MVVAIAWDWPCGVLVYSENCEFVLQLNNILALHAQVQWSFELSNEQP